MQTLDRLWTFFEKQILGMDWLNQLIGMGLSALGLDLNNRWVGSIHFFAYDVIKITILLLVLIFIMGYLQSYFPPERSKKLLGKVTGIRANIIGALLGTITPFCSCSSIPLFIGFTASGIPIGVTFSFLISSPMVDLASLILLMSIFGTKIALLYVLVGLVVAVIGGTLIEKLKMHRYVEQLGEQNDWSGLDSAGWNKKQRIHYAKERAFSIFKSVIPYVFIGVGIGAIIHNWIPQKWIETILGENNPFSVFIATIVGIPMYADEFGTIPIAEALLAKGAHLGTVLSFMMAVTTLSLPSIILLRKAVKPKLLILFVGICSVGIITVGYFFNFLQPYLLK